MKREVDYNKMIDGDTIFIAHNQNREIVCWSWCKNLLMTYLIKTDLYATSEIISSTDPKFIYAVQSTFSRYEVISGRDENDKLVVLIRKEYNYVMQLNYEMKSKIYDVVDNCRQLVNALDFSDKEYEKIRKMTVMLLKRATRSEMSTLPKGILTDPKSLRRATEMEDELYNFNDSADFNMICSQYCIILI